LTQQRQGFCFSFCLNEAGFSICTCLDNNGLRFTFGCDYGSISLAFGGLASLFGFLLFRLDYKSRLLRLLFCDLLLLN